MTTTDPTQTAEFQSRRRLTDAYAESDIDTPADPHEYERFTPNAQYDAMQRLAALALYTAAKDRAARRNG